MKKGKLSKIAAIAMAFTMACGILSGCGGSQSAKTADSAANQTTESAEGQTKGTQEAEDGKHINVAFSGLPQIWIRQTTIMAGF